MVKIKSVKGRQVFDSRGNPTVEAEIILDNGILATAISPSGASTGSFEAHELRDQDKNKFLGKSVNTAVKNINNKISAEIKGLNPDDQSNLDEVLLKLDGSINKNNLGANAMLAVSIANAKCSALAKKKSRILQLFSENSCKIGLFSQLQNTTIFENSCKIENQKTPIFTTIFSKKGRFYN